MNIFMVINKMHLHVVQFMIKKDHFYSGPSFI